MKLNNYKMLSQNFLELNDNECKNIFILDKYSKSLILMSNKDMIYLKEKLINLNDSIKKLT